MYRTTQRIRKAGVAALVAATALSGLAIFAPPASAVAISETILSLDELSTNTIGLAAAAQPAGSLRINNDGDDAVDTLTTGDSITITVDDSDVTANCAVVGDSIGFSAVPTATVTAPGTATVAVTVEESASCVLLGGAAVNDVVRLTVTAGGTAPAITLSGVAYTVGAAAELGAVQVNGFFDSVNPGAPAAFTDADVPADASNATITSTLVTANNPPTGSIEDSGVLTYAISPIVIKEQTTGAADMDLCLYFDTDLATSTLTVASSGGTDTATAAPDTAAVPDNIFLDTAGAGSATTFTISGILLENDSRNVQSVDVYEDDDDNCDNAPTGALLADNVNVGGVTDVERFGGSTRFTTAQILFEDNFFCADDVIIARADAFPDALAASYLAGDAVTGILLTNTNDVPAATINALRNEGVENVYLMGGTTAISAAVATQLDATPAYDAGCDPVVADQTLQVFRIGGADRYETAQLAAEFPGLGNAGDLDLNPLVAGGDDTTAIVASGENFPDALAAGPLAWDGDEGDEIPLLLTRQAAIPAPTLDALGNLGVVNVVVLGGTAAVSDAAVAQLTAAGYNVRRIAGATRQATAVALATAMISEWGFDVDDASLARGDNFPDSLAGGAWAGDDNQVVLLTGDATTLSADTAAFLAAWEGLFSTVFCDVELDDLDVFGGTSAVAASTVQAAVNAATQQEGENNC